MGQCGAIERTYRDGFRPLKTFCPAETSRFIPSTKSGAPDETKNSHTKRHALVHGLYCYYFIIVIIHRTPQLKYVRRFVARL